jgi:hypothetical protein
MTAFVIDFYTALPRAYYRWDEPGFFALIGVDVWLLLE